LRCCVRSRGQQEKRNLRIAYVSPSYSQSINWIAKQTGIFSKHGLNVEVIYMSGGKSTQALRAGSIDVSSMPDRRSFKRLCPAPIRF
jgi:ABC-type nitrate/sulfonate/bicarbonate transport system substrate-binding protein